MAGLKSLAKETAIYGLSSIVGRFLNYLLGARIYHGDVRTEWRLWRSDECICVGGLMLVLLTCGMETGFFRFANKGEDDPMRVYSTTLLSVSMGGAYFPCIGGCCFSTLLPDGWSTVSIPGTWA